VNPSGDRQQPARKCSTRLRSRGFGGWCRKLAVALHGEMAPIIGNEASKPASVARPPVGRQHYQNESKRNRFFWCPRQSQSGGALPAAPGGSSEADGVDGLGQAPMIQETSHGCKLLDGLDGLDGPFDAEEKRGQHAGTAQLGALAFEASVSEWNLLESDLYGRRFDHPMRSPHEGARADPGQGADRDAERGSGGREIGPNAYAVLTCSCRLSALQFCWRYKHMNIKG
jgi:hypothetical protein